MIEIANGLIRIDDKWYAFGSIKSVKQRAESRSEADFGCFMIIIIAPVSLMVGLLIATVIQGFMSYALGAAVGIFSVIGSLCIVGFGIKVISTPAVKIYYTEIEIAGGEKKTVSTENYHEHVRDLETIKRAMARY